VSALALELELDLQPRVARGREHVGAQVAGAGGATDLGGEPTLDALVAGVWEGLAAQRSVACPVCDEEMEPHYGAHARPIGGVCRGCGTRVS
jgi:hypothetical protein